LDRAEPQFFNIFEQPWRSLDEIEVTHGLETRLISHDTNTGAATFMSRLPSRWAHHARATDGTLELFVLEGTLTVDDDPIVTSGVVTLPQGTEPRKLGAPDGAQVLGFWSPGLPATEPRVTSVQEESWIETEMPHMQHSSYHKSLRIPDPGEGELHGGPGGVLRFVLIVPSLGSRQEEVHHACWEEIIVLRGDLMMPERGYAAPGTYIANPPDYWHGPWTSHGGNLHLVHTATPVGIEYRDYPGGPELVDDYVDTTSWVEQPAHRPWSDSDRNRHERFTPVKQGDG
jgi:hypothetical protein